jgi:hypothetical protein
VIQSHEELEVYQLAFKAAMRIFELSKGFPQVVCSMTRGFAISLKKLEASA